MRHTHSLLTILSFVSVTVIDCELLLLLLLLMLMAVVMSQTV